jgi:hypothetical protein
VYDLEGEDITNAVLFLDLDANRGVATCVVRENGLRFYDGGRPWTFEVLISRVTGTWEWPHKFPLRSSLLVK